MLLVVISNKPNIPLDWAQRTFNAPPRNHEIIIKVQWVLFTVIVSLTKMYTVYTVSQHFPDNTVAVNVFRSHKSATHPPHWNYQTNPGMHTEH